MYRAAAFTSVNHNQTASPVKIDGQNAYVPGAVDESYPGFIDTTYSFAADPTNGNLSLVEHDALLTCPGETYDVGLTSCPALVNSGIRLDRTITQDHEGQQSRVSDKWVNTTGAPHTLTLAYSNGFDDPIDAQFPIGTTVQLATPGQSVVGPFAAPSTTSIAVNGFPDNSPTRARGAITTYPGADSAIFANSSRFFLNYATTIAAGGTYSVDSVYNQAFSGAEVAQLAAAARASLTPIAPPVALQPTFGKATTAKATYSKKTKKITLSTGRSVICPAGGPACAVSGKLTSKVLIAKKKGKKKAKYKTYTIGTLKVTAQPGTTEALSLVLSKSSAKLLLKYRKLKITVPISVNAGAASQSATFTVTAPKIPKKK
jgi:hypothetical protein